MKLMAHGRKFFLTVAFLLMGNAILVASYFLALKGKLTSEWVQLVTIWLPMAGGVTGVFAATNAYVSGKAIKAGQELPPANGAEA